MMNRRTLLRSHRRHTTNHRARQVRPRLLRLEDRAVPATFNWTGGVDGNGTNWSDANNWGALQVPGNDDSVVIGPTGTSPTINIASASVHDIKATTRNLTITETLTAVTDEFDHCNVDFNGGTLVAADSEWIESNISGTTTFVNTGDLTLKSSNVGMSVENSGTIHASWSWNIIFTSNSLASLVNSGTLDVSQSTSIGSITTTPGSTIKVLSSTLLQMSLTVASGFVNHGSITILSERTDWQFNVSSGTMVNAADGVIRVVNQGAMAKLNFSSLDNEGLIAVDPSSKAYDPAVVAIGAGGTLENYGEMTINSKAFVSLGTGAVFTNSGDMQVNDSTGVSLGTGAVFTNSGMITVAYDRTLYASLTNAAGGVLTGTGKIVGDVIGPGLLRLAYWAGVSMSITGNVSLGELEISDWPLPPMCLRVDGTVALSGPLNVRLNPNDITGESKVIINNDGSDAVSGNFAGLPQLGIFQVGTRWLQVNYKGGTGNDVTLTVIPSPPRVQNVVINEGTAQRSRLTSVQVSFNTVVTLPAAPETAFQLKRQSDNALVGLAAMVTSGSTTTVTLTFPGALSEFGSLVDGAYQLTVLASQVSNAAGQLDGNGDGTGGDDYLSPASGVGSIFRLFGDADGDGDVEPTDYGIFCTAFGGGDATFDFDGDGDVDATDFGQFRLRFGATI